MLKLIILLASCAVLAVVSRARAADRPAATRLTPRPYQTGRSVVMAPHGMVATSQPLAAQVGLEILRKGGTAVDAAIATNAMLGLVEPMSCGVGGDLYAIVWDAKEKKLLGLNASGRSPYKATRAFFAEKGLKEIPLLAPLSWSVPGCVSGWEALHGKFGKLPLTDIDRKSVV
jgi:gamma-glutamyltranspeptidase / glutathione hydrolase